MIFGINTTSDISKLSQISLHSLSLVKLRITISKYHSWYLCQIWLQIMLLPILKSAFCYITVGMIRHLFLQTGFWMLTYLISPSVHNFFHKFQKMRTCFKFNAKQVFVYRGSSWQILAKKVLKKQVLSRGCLLYNSDNCIFYVTVLGINETAPTPTLAEPRTPSAEEELEAVQITILHNSTVSIFLVLLVIVLWFDRSQNCLSSNDLVRGKL